MVKNTVIDEKEKEIYLKFIEILIKLFSYSTTHPFPNSLTIPTIIFANNRSIYKTNPGLFQQVCQLFLNSNVFSFVKDFIHKKDKTSVESLYCTPFLIYIPIYTVHGPEKAKKLEKYIFKKILELNADKDREVNATCYQSLISNIYYAHSTTDSMSYETLSFILTRLAEQIKSEFFDKQFSCLKFLSAVCEKEKYVDFIVQWYKETKFADFLISMDFKPTFMPIYGIIFKQIASFGLFSVDGFRTIWKYNEMVQDSEYSSFAQMIIPVFQTLPKDFLHQCLVCTLCPKDMNEKWLDMIKSICIQIGRRKVFQDEIAFIIQELTKIAKKSKDKELTAAIEELVPVLQSIGISYDEFLEKVKNIITKVTPTNSELDSLSLLLSQNTLEDKELVLEIFDFVLRTAKTSLAMNRINLIQLLVRQQKMQLNAQHVNLLLQKAVISEPTLVMLFEFLHDGSVTHEDVYEASKLFPESKINEKFFSFIRTAFFKNISVIDSLPFKEEKLLWSFAQRKSSSQAKFQKLLCSIYSKNNEEYLSDSDMIHAFLQTWRDFFSQAKSKDQKNSLIQLLTTFINVIERNIVIDHFGIDRHRMVREENRLTVHVELVDEYSDSNSDSCGAEKANLEFNFIADRKESPRVILYRACDYFKLSAEEFTLYHGDLPIDFDDADLRQFEDEGTVSLYLVSGVNEPEPVRTEIPSNVIANSDLHSALYSELDGLDVRQLLDTLPTLRSVVDSAKAVSCDTISSFFPKDKKFTFLYNFETFVSLYSDGLITDSVLNGGCLDYLIDEGLDASSSYILNPLLDFIGHVLVSPGVEVNTQRLFERVTGIINTFMKPTAKSEVCRNCFRLLQDIPDPESIALDEEEMRTLIENVFGNKYESMRSDALDFLYRLPIPQSLYSLIYADSPSQSAQFFTSWADHITSRDPSTVAICMSFIGSPSTVDSGQLDMIDAHVEKRLLTAEETKRVVTFICTYFLDPRAEAKDHETFKSAMEIIKHSEGDPLIVSAINKLARTKFYFKSWDIDGESIALHQGTEQHIGLENLGVTCFVDSTLQQLFRVTRVRQLIFNYNGADEFTRQLRFLFGQLTMSNLNAVSTKDLLSSWESDGSDPFEYDIQQDACEFLELLFDKLERSVGKEITRDFTGAFTNRIESLDGTFKSESRETFLCLPVDVENSKTLSESLAKISTPDFLRGDNAYKFDGETKVDAKKYCEVTEAPKNLIIQLKRFQYDFETWRRYKVKSPLEYPLDLELAGWSYRLSGVVMHSGTADYGHYISLCKQPDGKWIKFNDDIVSEISESDVLTVGTGKSDKNAWTAFLLFYDSAEQEPVSFPDDLLSEVQEDNDYNCFCRLAFSQSTTDVMLHFADSTDDDLLLSAAIFAVSFVPYLKHKKIGLELFRSVNRTLKTRDAVCQRLAKELQSISIINTVIVVPNAEVRRAFSDLCCILVSKCGKEALLCLVRSINEWSESPQNACEMIDIYEYAAHFDSCREYLKKKILPLLENFVASLRKQYRMTSAFRAILSIGPSKKFVSSLCKENWVTYLIDTTDIDVIARIVALGTSEEVKRFLAIANQRQSISTAWKEIPKLVEKYTNK